MRSLNKSHIVTLVLFGLLIYLGSSAALQTKVAAGGSCTSGTFVVITNTITSSTVDSST